MDGSNYRDAEFVSEVAEDVLGVLRKSHFFGRLETRFAAPLPAAPPQPCSHSFAQSVQILRELGMDTEDIGDVLAVFRLRGAACDCEVLQHVGGRNRVEMPFWKPKTTDRLIAECGASPYVN